MSAVLYHFGTKENLVDATQDRLLDTITRLSAEGSQLATEMFIPPTHDIMQPVTQRWRHHGFDIDFSDLEYHGERNHVATYLNNHGWQSVVTPISQLFADNDLPLRAGRLPLSNDRYLWMSLGEAA